MGSTRAWLIWGVGLSAYIVGLLQRTTLGVAGEEAAAQFGSSFAVISTFVMIQVATYAAGQLPAGALIDSFGPRKVMAAGSVVMAAGQFLIAFADSLPQAFTARILVGAGDSCLFISVIRLLPAWFPSKRVPILSQLTGMAGQLGQVAAVGAFLPALRHFGWQPAFIAVGCLSVAASLLALAVVRDTPGAGSTATNPVGLAQLPGAVAEVMRHPGTQLGFWIHFTTGVPFFTFLTMWGMPYLSIAGGQDETTAAMLFSVASMGSLLTAPIIGHLTARFPLRRSSLALALVAASTVSWLVVLLWPGHPPLWALALLMITLSTGGPAGGIGFDFPRTLLPLGRLGMANGIVNVGGFGGTTLCLLVIALALEAMGADRTPTPAQLEAAMWLQLPFVALGVVAIVITRAHVRRHSGVTIPTWREVAERYRKRG